MSFVSFLIVFSFSPPPSLSLPNFAFHVHHISLVFRFIYPSIRLHILFIFSNLCCCVYYATLDGHRAYFSPVCVSLPRLLVIVVIVVIRSFLCANKWEGRKKEGKGTKSQQKREGGNRNGMCVTYVVCVSSSATTIEDAFVAHNQSFRTCRTFVSLAVSGNVSAWTSQHKIGYNKSFFAGDVGKLKICILDMNSISLSHTSNSNGTNNVVPVRLKK